MLNDLALADMGIAVSTNLEASVAAKLRAVVSANLEEYVAAKVREVVAGRVMKGKIVWRTEVMIPLMTTLVDRKLMLMGLQGEHWIRMKTVGGYWKQRMTHGNVGELLIAL